MGFTHGSGSRHQQLPLASSDHCKFSLHLLLLSTDAHCTPVSDSAAHGSCSKHKGQEAGTLGVSMLCSSIWNHSQPITNSSFLAAIQLSPSLSLSSFHPRWQWNCRPHSALINNLQRKTTKLVNWHTRSTLTPGLSFIMFLSFFIHRTSLSMRCVQGYVAFYQHSFSAM